MDRLSVKQQRAIEALLSGATQTEAAEAAGVTSRQLRRWITENVQFRRALREAENAALNRVTRHLVRLADTACSVLAQALRGEAKPVQLRAADITLQRMLNIRELIDLEQRVNALEERFDESQKPNR